MNVFSKTNDVLIFDNIHMTSAKLHIKLGLIKNYVKAMDRHGNTLQHLRNKFSLDKSEAKLKEGVFVGPEICELMIDDEFKQKLKPVESAAWEAFVLAVQNFLGNYRSDNYVELVYPLQDFKVLYKYCIIIIIVIIIMLTAYQVMENRYREKFNRSMMGNYCWFLQRETDVQFRRKSKCSKHF